MYKQKIYRCLIIVGCILVMMGHIYLLACGLQQDDFKILSSVVFILASFIWIVSRINNLKKISEKDSSDRP